MYKQLIAGFLTLFLVFVFSPAYSADKLIGSEMMRSGQMMGQASTSQKTGMHRQAGGQPAGYWPVCGVLLNPGMMGQGQGAMQSGMMGNMMQPGMMGNMTQPGMMGQGMHGNVSSLQAPLTKDDVRVLMEYKLRFFIRNPNLKLGKIKETEEGFEVQIVTRDDSLVNQFVIDKNTGIMKPGN